MIKKLKKKKHKNIKTFGRRYINININLKLISYF